jgi:uncharacterized pyridoxal phosphate-containing UPF0001 family protein
MYELREKILNEFKVDKDSFILSMGTSADFEVAVRK